MDTQTLTMAVAVATKNSSLNRELELTILRTRIVNEPR